MKRLLCCVLALPFFFQDSSKTTSKSLLKAKKGRFKFSSGDRIERRKKKSTLLFVVGISSGMSTPDFYFIQKNPIPNARIYLCRRWALEKNFKLISGSATDIPQPSPDCVPGTPKKTFTFSPNPN
ncbi:MAG TPA: hypothetical protein VK255_00590 [Patescibacteria group bacterium]|nr:hypothetical protein [Patescibacteria group bacterium]